jgi:single-stranded DNA-binding protein
LRSTANGTPALKFTLACNFRNGDYEEVHFQDCQLFGKVAEVFSGLERGDAVWVMGRMRAYDWEDKDGQKRRNHALLVNEIRPVTHRYRKEA